MSERSCAWMSGPKDATLMVPAAKWWLAISRDVLMKDYRRRTSMRRPAVICNLTPKFSSPLAHK